MNSPSTSGLAALHSEDRLRLLIETGLRLAQERDLGTMVQAALDAGLQLCGAGCGAFFYNNLGEDGVPYPLYKLAGLDAAAFRAFPMPDAAEVFSVEMPEPDPRGILRARDITRPPEAARFANRTPFRFMPAGRPPVRSYIAVPVRNRSGEVLGGLLYGHTAPDAFDAECADLLATVASQAAVAIDNFRLTETLGHEIALADSARALQRQTSDRLRQALDAAHLGTWSWDRRTDQLDMDDRAAQLFGLRSGETITRTALRERVVVAEDRSHTTENLRQALESGGLYHAEYRVDTDGGATWLSSSGIATFAPGSAQATGMVGTVQDVTARKTQEATLRESEKLAATGRMAATIAHEINNPLEAVTNLIYLCKTDPDVPTDIQRLLETADMELARVAQIAQQTLGFYRDTTRPVLIDLNKLLEGIVELFARKLAYKQVTARLDLETGLSVHGLQGEVRQAFSNLVVNAIDASTGGDILVRGRHCRDGVSVLVADRGVGIPAEARPRLFSPFFTTKQSVGTGLGLWVTRGILEKQGGRIGYRSRTEAPSGTVFRVFLPAGPVTLGSFDAPLTRLPQ